MNYRVKHYGAVASIAAAAIGVSMATSSVLAPIKRYFREPRCVQIVEKLDKDIDYLNENGLESKFVVAERDSIVNVDPYKSWNIENSEEINKEKWNSLIGLSLMIGGLTGGYFTLRKKEDS